VFGLLITNRIVRGCGNNLVFFFVHCSVSNFDNVHGEWACNHRWVIFSLYMYILVSLDISNGLKKIRVHDDPRDILMTHDVSALPVTIHRTEIPCVIM